MPCSRYVIYSMRVFNLACGGICKLDRAYLPHSGLIFLILLTFLEYLNVVLISLVCYFDDFSKIGYSRSS